MGDPTAPQKCKYCDRPAYKSYIWAEGRAYIPVCSQHELTAREDIAEQNDAIVDTRLIKGTHESVSFGARVRGQRKLSALDEAPIRGAGKQPGSRLSVDNVRDAGSFLRALGLNWRQLRARRVHDHRISVDIDGAKFTLYTRNG